MAYYFIITIASTIQLGRLSLTANITYLNAQFLLNTIVINDDINVHN